MDFLNDNGAESRIFLEALVTYSDSCTLPLLTPSCPFYRSDIDGPTCGEQCREIAHAHGVGNRTVTDVAVGGLVMTGREIPFQSVAGADLFDATQKFIVEHEQPLAVQSTTTLLFGLQSVFTRRLPFVFTNPSRQALDIWSEISHRGVPIENIVSGSLLRQFAYTVATWAVVSNLSEMGLVQENYDRESRSVEQTAWGSLLGQIYEDFDSSHATSSATEGLRGELPKRPSDWLETIAKNEDAAEQIRSSALVKFAFSDFFIGRVEEWFFRLLEDDLDGLIRASVPPFSVFQALPIITACRDEMGLWLWDRFTETNLSDWSTSSLLFEYRAGKGDRTESVPRRILAERSVPLEDVAELVLERVSNTRGRQIQRRGLHPSNFAQSAAAQLSAGNYAAAESIFYGLIELRSSDGEAWNNLGFCQIASDPGKALSSLRRAAVFQRKPSSVNVANQVLALHLLRRDEEALIAGTKYLGQPLADKPGCVLWKHPEENGALEIQEVNDISEYMTRLVEHIRDQNCVQNVVVDTNSSSAGFGSS